MTPADISFFRIILASLVAFALLATAYFRLPRLKASVDKAVVLFVALVFAPLVPVARLMWRRSKRRLKT